MRNTRSKTFQNLTFGEEYQRRICSQSQRLQLFTMNFTSVMQKSAGNILISSLILTVLEKSMDNDFICPCQSVYNKCIFVLYAVVPTIICFFFVLNFVDNKGMEHKSKRNVFSSIVPLITMERRQDTRTQGRDDISESQALRSGVTSPEDKETECISRCKELLHAALITLIWLFLFFIDGRYFSCAFSHWGGEYTETGALKWCRPMGNKTLVFERLQETQKWIFISQCIGFFIALMIALILGLSYCFRSSCCKRCCRCYSCCNSCLDACLGHARRNSSVAQSD